MLGCGGEGPFKRMTLGDGVGAMFGELTFVQETVDLRWMMGGVGPSLIYGGGAAKAAATNKDARVTLENMTTD